MVVVTIALTTETYVTLKRVIGAQLIVWGGWVVGVYEGLVEIFFKCLSG